MDMINIENLTKFYGKSRGIDHISLQVEQGEFFGFIGPNGAGKSTTIRTLLGLITPTSGKAFVHGYDITEEKEKILSVTGYLPSEVTFYQGMRVKDILKLSADLRKKNCEIEAKRLCERLQLDLQKKVEELSFGNKKKVGIVCALQHNPKLLVLDEPTSGLDPFMQKEFFDILQEKHKEGITIFLSSHVLSEIQRYCTRAAIIREGKIMACDTVNALAKTNAKRVRVFGKVNLSDLSGVLEKEEAGERESFLYTGEIGQLLKCLSEGAVKDVSISEPDLEEIFLHYYKKDGELG